MYVTAFRNTKLISKKALKIVIMLIIITTNFYCSKPKKHIVFMVNFILSVVK